MLHLFFSVRCLTYFALRYDIYFLQKCERPFFIWTNLTGLLARTHLGNEIFVPVYGISGIAWSSVIAYWLMTILSLYFLLPLTLQKPDGRQMRTLIYLGIPVACSGICDTSFFAVTSLMVGMLGVAKLSTHYLALQFLYLPFVIPYSINVAASVRIAYWMGKHERESILSVVKYGLMLGTFPLFLISASYLVFNVQIEALWLVAIFQLLNAIQTILMGSLRGLADTSIPFLINLTSYWVVGVPLCYVMSLWFGLQGVWGGMIVTQCILVTLLYKRVSTVYLPQLILRNKVSLRVG